MKIVHRPWRSIRATAVSGKIRARVLLIHVFSGMEGDCYYAYLQKGVSLSCFAGDAKEVRIDDEVGEPLRFDEGDDPAPANPERFSFHSVEDLDKDTLLSGCYTLEDRAHLEVPVVLSP
jgi:hypothetical protein